MSTVYSQNHANSVLHRIKLQRGLVFGAIIILALLAFEIFNFSTTSFALQDLLGDLSFLGIYWSTILAIAFCSIDFAGLARLFTPEENGRNEPKEVWYLFGAWLLAATMNAMLTWWGISIAILNNHTLGSAVIERETLLKIVPIFVAVLVWLIRVLIIGTFSVAGNRLFTLGDQPSTNRSIKRNGQPATPRPVIPQAQMPAPKPTPVANFRPAPKQGMQPEASYARPEPTYSPLQGSANQGAPAARYASAAGVSADYSERTRQG